MNQNELADLTKLPERASEFRVLPKSAGLKQHMVHIKKHAGAIMRSLWVNLGGSRCVGYELTRINEELELKGEKLDAHCKKVLPFTSRQAQFSRRRVSSMQTQPTRTGGTLTAPRRAT